MRTVIEALMNGLFAVVIGAAFGALIFTLSLILFVVFYGAWQS